MKTFGQVSLRDGGWWIETDPHVAMRLKRVFAKVEPSPRKFIVLSDTVEHGYELRWFCDRYPMTFDAVALAHLLARAKEYEERQRALQEVFALGYRPPVIALAKPLRQYQALGADLAYRSRGGGLLIADDVGLGKSAEAIGLIAREEARPALVVTLTHLPPQWKAEIEKFLPDARSHVLKRATPYPLPSPMPDVLITSYSKLRGWAETLAGHVKTVVWDEVQELRTGPGDATTTNQKYAAAQLLASRAEYRLGLSATPIYNYGDEMYHVMESLAPGALGTEEEFGREWCGGYFGKKSRIAKPRVFGAYLREAGLMLRRTRQDVGRELPPVSRLMHTIDADPKALDAIRADAVELAKIILRETVGPKGEKLQASQKLSYKLRQATGIAKAPHVAAFVRILLEAGEQVVLYGWHHAVYGLWKAMLDDLRDEQGRPTPPAFYTGEETVGEKDEARRRFVERKTPLLIMSLRAGAGLDGLQGATRTVVFGELDWSPGVHEQCIGRVHRDGQAEPVMAYFLVAESGSDPVVADVLGLKREQSEGVRDPDGELFEELQTDPDHIKRLAREYLQRQRSKSA